MDTLYMNINMSLTSFCRAIFLSIVLLGSFIFTTTPALAQSSGGAGVGLSPAVIEEPMGPGETRQFNLEISNLSATDQTYYLFRKDITGVRPGGVPIFAEENAERTGFELSEWITLGVTEVDVPVNESAVVSFILEVPENASPGSHFGGVFVSVEPPKLRSTGAAVGYEVANIISIRVAGEALESAQIRQFSTDKYLYGSTNIKFLVRIENEGNVLVRPTGPLEVNNMFGKQVALLNFNESLSGVFPNTDRDFEITWEDESPGFGRYEAVLSTSYGSEGQKNTISSTVTFWILPMNILVPAIIILAVILLSIYVGVKLYIRRTMAVMSAGKTRRLVKSRRHNEFPLLMVIVSMLTVTALFLIILLLIFS